MPEEETFEKGRHVRLVNDWESLTPYDNTSVLNQILAGFGRKRILVKEVGKKYLHVEDPNKDGEIYPFRKKYFRPTDLF